MGGECMPVSTFTFIACRRCLSAVLATHSGMVAERRAVCRSLGVLPMMDSTSGANPRSSISSASSSTRNRTEPRSRVPCRRCSNVRPGVAMRIWGPFLNAAYSGRKDRPPYRSTTRSCCEEARASTTSATCMASSRVGTSTSAWIPRDDGSHRSTSGTANARVFPDPVRACPIKSRPAMREGIAFSWIGVGLEMFIRAIAALVVVFKGIPENRGRGWRWYQRLAHLQYMTCSYFHWPSKKARGDGH